MSVAPAVPWGTTRALLASLSWPALSSTTPHPRVRFRPRGAERPAAQQERGCDGWGWGLPSQTRRGKLYSLLQEGHADTPSLDAVHLGTGGGGFSLSRLRDSKKSLGSWRWSGSRQERRACRGRRGEEREGPGPPTPRRCQISLGRLFTACHRPHPGTGRGVWPTSQAPTGKAQPMQLSASAECRCSRRGSPLNSPGTSAIEKACYGPYR